MKSVKRILQIIQEDVIGTENRYMAMAWFACLSGLLALGMYLSSESMSFLGVADSRELQVNFEYPVEIKRIHVIPGQNVKKGDLLVELDQSELNGQIRLIRAQISKLDAERSVRRTLNRIVSNASDLRTSDPLSVEIDDLTEEMGDLENQRKNLYVFAEVDGIVGGVNFKKGEKVPAFTGLVTLSPKNPSYVEGFLHENLPTKVEIGRKVTVTPVSSGTPPVEGKVVSVGSRIVLMPLRLSHYPNVQVWGREVVVEIPPQSGFLLGEKVQIKPHLELWNRLTRDMWLIDKAFAKEKKTSREEKVSLEELAPKEMISSAELAKRFHLEPSGVIYLSDLKKFLVVSDDTDKQKSASLFLVEADGTVLDQVLVVPGVGKVSDLESISQQGEWIYLMTSQGLNKKGKDKSPRNQFIRVKRSGLSLSDTQSVEFKPLLIKAIEGSKDQKLKAAFRTLKSPGDFEIESHFVDGSDLYLGFKNPMSADHQSLILVIHNFDSLFRTKTLAPGQLAASQWIDFGKSVGAPHRLSDLVQINGTLFATTVCREEDCGGVWKIQKARREGDRFVAEQLRFYEGVRPEGLAFDPSDSSLFVTFDQKSETPRFARLPIETPVLGTQQIESAAVHAQ